ncbi:MAG TPA: hypothetical protein VGV37_24170 [Aliidongia sp.]|uniref:hypothetical protein n=1 Tax=Aliidongia sp. TaxID=1914230 RepID=UPI002DDD7E78|nr:hypothetical protein [Aliidongia sp.]HEV2677649.1 hypothetical protein [Aliidongia sp.]
MSERFLRLTATVLIAICLAGPLAACGKKGAPYAPKDQPNVYPRAYPSSPGTPATPADPNVFPSVDQPSTNIDPTQSRSIE